MHPQLDLIDEIIRLFGWPALLAAFVWAVRKYDAGAHDFKEVRENTELAVKKVAVVETEINTIKTNHLAHLQEGISKVAESNDKAVEILQNIDKGISLLVDRGNRA